MALYNVYYMRPEWFPNGICGKKPNLKNLPETHILLTSIEVNDQGEEALDVIYNQMQGEVWSPNGEARPLIQSKGLKHTSMSVGDVIECEGKFWVVAVVGFEPL